MVFKTNNYDIIFLSYDEPNADANYEDLQSKIPWAKRIHGVKGSDAAHKACAEISETDRFIIVDADNIIDKMFLYHEVDINEDEIDINNCVFSWSAINIINNLQYGNGGIKSWNKDIINNMRTHEHAAKDDIQSQVDFCWNLQYVPFVKCFSTVYNNGSPFQSWRAGFREGVKLALHQGAKLSKEQLLHETIDNLQRLCMWMMVGNDVRHGLWAILGARQGLVKLMCTDWNYIQVRDFDYLETLWENNTLMNTNNLQDATESLGEQIIKELNIPITADPLNAEQSIFVKTIFRQPPRI